MAAPVILLIGAVGAGKTTALMNLTRQWRASGRDVRGILAHRVMEEERLIGYDLEVIGEGKRASLARRGGTGLEKIGPFAFSKAGLALGRRALRESAAAQVVIVDEIGPLELKEGGWAREVVELLRESGAALVLVVREDLSDEVRRWVQPFRQSVHVFQLDELVESELVALLYR
jgi:nucleoside-triphosphatase THEP1